MLVAVWLTMAVLPAPANMCRTSTPSATTRSESRDYSEALKVIAQQGSIDVKTATSQGRSVFLTHGRRATRAVVLLHGFGNSPFEFRGLADSLYADGSNVWVPRLPYHATLKGPVVLSRLKAEDLRNAVESAVDIGTGLGDSVIVLGFSMGGVAAAWAAQCRSDIERVVIVSPALALGHVPVSLDRPLVSMMLHLPNITHRLVRDPTRTDREIGWSTHAIAQILRLGLSIKRASERSSPLVQDIQLLINAHDQTVSTAAALALARRWAIAGAKVSVYQLSDSLRLPHDIIDATEPGGCPQLIDPILIALVRNTPVPAWVARVATNP